MEDKIAVIDSVSGLRQPVGKLGSSQPQKVLEGAVIHMQFLKKAVKFTTLCVVNLKSRKKRQAPPTLNRNVFTYKNDPAFKVVLRGNTR